ncbi:hypothetical protein [Acidicapsa acidisoli]|uniref:hypothetical protein n=1 Tax=Acidicapsa acidisoli TaxID=1615681 RepID=UPI0021DF7401|nr:hypothetical protein [Acidicapsa acidisoli]
MALLKSPAPNVAAPPASKPPFNNERRLTERFVALDESCIVIFSSTKKLHSWLKAIPERAFVDGCSDPEHSDTEMGRCHWEARRLSFVGDEEMTFQRDNLLL